MDIPAGAATPGPAPTTRHPDLPAVSAARAAVLEALGARSPATIADLAAGTGLHVSTLREHLRGLVDAGAVRRRRTAPQGRGRPAWRYERIDPVTTAEYVGLSIALASILGQTDDPRGSAVAAGRTWGAALRDARPDATGRDLVVDVLDRMGFSPDDAGHGRVRLTRCPLLEAARRYEDVVCSVHLGMVRGLVPDTDGVGLRPFAEPDACVLDLPVSRAPHR